MPKSFSEKERGLIISELRLAAAESISRAGIKKTTVDELVKAAHIPKGTFYLFYESKEMLIFDVMMRWHEEIHMKLQQSMASLAEGITIDSLTEAFFAAYKAVFDTPLPKLMMSGELELLIRRLPEALVEEHFKNDDMDFSAITAIIPGIDEEKTAVYTAAARALFFTIAYRREIGGEIFDDALRLCLRGLVMQMLEDAK